MIKGFVKTNGIFVACCCMFYAVFYSLGEKNEKFIEQSWFGRVLSWLVMEPEEKDKPMHFLLIVASLVMIAGIFLERKRLLIPIVAASFWTMKIETKGTFKVEKYQQALFIHYAAISVVLLLLVLKPFSCCCKESKCQSNAEVKQDKLQTVVVKKSCL